MIRRPPRSTLSSSSAASDVYKRQPQRLVGYYQVATHDPTSSAPISCPTPPTAHGMGEGDRGSCPTLGVNDDGRRFFAIIDKNLGAAPLRRADRAGAGRLDGRTGALPGGRRREGRR